MTLRRIDISNAATFWVTLFHLLTRRHAVLDELDVKIEKAIPRARWITAWTVLALGCTLIVLDVSQISQFLLTIPAAKAVLPLYWVLSITFAMAVAIPVAYGFLRMYTLISHVLILNVFRTRGQRLRLLNFLCTVMTLSVPLSAGLLAYAVSPLIGAAVLAAILIYGLVLMSLAFNVIFHKRYLGGLGLVVGGTLVTWFVLAIGVLAISVTLAVLAFFVLVVMRVFKH